MRPSEQQQVRLVRQPRLGVDIGRVIIDGSAAGGGDTAFFDGSVEAMLATPAVPGAFDSIARLAVLFSGRVWLVSKCGPKVQARSLQWLEHHRFWQLTGVQADQVRFCRARADKRGHCEDLGLTHFVDDKLDVHQAVREVVEQSYLFGPQHGPAPTWVTVTPTWADVEAALLWHLGV